MADPAWDTLSEPSPSQPPRARAALCLEWLAGQPLVVPAVGMTSGIVLDACGPVPMAGTVGLFVLAGVLLARGRRHDSLCHLAILLAGLALGAALHDLSFRRWPADHIVRYCGPEPVTVRLTGTVISTPVIRPVQTGRIRWFSQSPRTRMHVAAEKLRGVSGDIHVCGTVAVLIREPAPRITAGDRVELLGTLYRAKPPANPGEHDYALASRRRGVLVHVSCLRAANVRVESAVGTRHRRLSALRRRARAGMLANTFRGDEPGSQLLSAMVLGQRSAVTPELNDAFAATGTVHFLSVSGAHVGMLASVLWLTGILVGASRRTCAAWVLVAITAYAVLAEPRPPILRAMLVGDLLCVGILLRRPVRSLNWLALAAMILLAVRPTQLFEPGFQLSFVTVIAILYLCPHVHRTARDLISRRLHRDDPLLSAQLQKQLTPPTRAHRMLAAGGRVLGWWLTLTISAWMVSLLLAGHHFHRVAAWGWFNNLLVLPLVWVTEVLGLTKTVLAVVSPPLGKLLGGPLALVTDALIGLVAMLARLPGSGWSTPAVPAWLAAAGLAVLALWVLSGWLRIKGRWVAMTALAFATLAAWRLAPAGPSDACRVHLLAVGSGTACVIQLPNGHTLLYDIGAMPPYDIEKWTVGPFLARERVYEIATAVISHANLDHYCGLPDLAEHRSVDVILGPPHFARDAATSTSAARVLAEMRRQAVAWHVLVRGDRLTGTGDARIEVLWPPPLGELAIKKTNDTGIVLRISYAGRRVLLCGDIEEFAQQHLLALADLKADVLVLPHHGGVGSTTAAFIKAVDPTWCIRSSGQRDAHTDNGILDLVADRKYFNTADDGAIEIRMTPTALQVSPQRKR